MPIDILNLPLLCSEHIRELSRIYRAEEALDDREFIRALKATDSCPACLHLRWKDGFDRASQSVRTDSVDVYLRDMAELKRTFPGYPLETTPRQDCRSVEEYLLKEGHSFQSAALAPEELDTVRSVLEELKRLRAEELQSTKKDGVSITISPLLDMGRAFSTTQLAWRAGKGVLEYVEGFARHGEGSPLRFGWDREGSGLRYHTWNLINGKVVDFCSRRRPREDDEFWRMLRDLPQEVCVVGVFDVETEYFGSVLTQGLEKQFKSIPDRLWGERILVPDESDTSFRESLRKKRKRGRGVNDPEIWHRGGDSRHFR